MNSRICVFRIAMAAVLMGMALLPASCSQGSAEKRDATEQKELQEAETEAGKKSSPVRRAETGGLTKTYEKDGISFLIDPEWTEIAEHEGMFLLDEGDMAVGINGISNLGFMSAEEFYDGIQEYYASLGESIQEVMPLVEWESQDGVICRFGRILYTDPQGALNCMDVIIAPDKNRVISMNAQCRTSRLLSKAQELMDELRGSLAFRIGERDYAGGNVFLDWDGSELCLKDDGSFRWYRSEADHENNYFEGTYEVYYGQPAFEKITSIPEAGLTMEELEQTLQADMNGYSPGGSKPSDYLRMLEPDAFDETDEEVFWVCRDTFYAILLHNDRLAGEGGEEKALGVDTLYIGYYIPELETFDLLNVSSAARHSWKASGPAAEMND